jgi:hypothetical protein
MLNLIALVFAGILVAAVAVAIGTSNAGPAINLSVGEFQKLAPNYWNKAASRMSYNIISAPTLVGPAWTPDELPGAHPAVKPKKPAWLTPPAVAQTGPLPFEDDDLLGLPEDDDLSGLWADSPSPLGRVGAAA